MTMEIDYPDFGKFLHVPLNAYVVFSVKNCEGDMVKVFRKLEGEVYWEQIGQFLHGGETSCKCVFKVGDESTLIAQTSDGLFTGDYGTIKLEDWSTPLPEPISYFTYDIAIVPGKKREPTQTTSAKAASDHEPTSSEDQHPVFSAGECCWQGHLTKIIPTSGEADSATDVSLTSLGACCPCSSKSTEGSTPEGGANADGSPQTPTNLVNVASRGLPLVFTTVHCSNEQFIGPWGWYRSLGVYRKLLEQNTDEGHVSIFQQDATRLFYAKIGDAYISAAGQYGSLMKTDIGWLEKTKSGVYYEYNAHGNLRRVLDPNRNEHYYVYNDNTSSQKILEIKAEKGLRPYFYYDPSDDTLCTRIALRDLSDSSKNKYIYFDYDIATKLMTQATGPEGCEWNYDYDGSGHITRVTDPDNYSTYFCWDGG